MPLQQTEVQVRMMHLPPVGTTHLVYDGSFVAGSSFLRDATAFLFRRINPVLLGGSERWSIVSPQNYYSPYYYEIFRAQLARGVCYGIPTGALGILPDDPSFDDLIDECILPENLEEGEEPPSQKAIDDLRGLLKETAVALGYDVPVGDVMSYFGEIAVVWRNSHRMVRAATFSDMRSPRVDYGMTEPGTVGEYHHEIPVSGEILARHLRDLYS